MTTVKIHSFFEDYFDNIFGEYEPTETDMKLIDAIISKNLPGDVDWIGNELWAPIGNDYDGSEIWQNAIDTAASEFYGISTNEEYRATADFYGLTVPADYEYIV